jgi:two-component system nitrogen regulation response regulator NtrX|tara:strand:- start:3204 stop:4562 length:1359 start_codon:yes stop_codon:yes gene_type:complete
MTNEILIVDDNPDIRNILEELISDLGYKIRVAANYQQALFEIDKKLPDVALLDVKLSKTENNEGLKLLDHIKNKNIDIPVIIISGHANIEMAVDSLKLGAFEFIQKPFDKNRLTNFINRAVENFNLKKENKSLNDKLFNSFDIVGESKNISNIRDQIDHLASSESRIFITGPIGSGKELVARKIHLISNRKNKPFIIINGALLNSEKYEKELFGEELLDGSIVYGALEKASGGVLLIDEVTEIPLETQSKILRVLIDQKFKRINGKHDVNVDVRIICSTNKDLSYEIQIGNFREDLFHRLNVFNIKLEPLNKRINDIPILVEYFMEKLSEIYSIKKIEIKDFNFLLNYDWPGNVRELRNLVERIIILSPGQNQDKINEVIKESLTKSSSHEFNISENLSFTLREARENFEREYLTSQLKKFSGNISKTAKFVGMERSALHRKLKLLEIKEFN